MSVTLTLKDNYGEIVEVDTTHAHAAPRGEVYLTVEDAESQGIDHSTAALSPADAREVAAYLIEAADELDPPKPSPAGRPLLPIATPVVAENHPDAPDVDPAEPKPEGGGCCGGGCCG